MPTNHFIDLTGTRVVRSIAIHRVSLALEAEQRCAGEKAEQKRPHDQLQKTKSFVV
jgi:hypothetical protein